MKKEIIEIKKGASNKTMTKARKENNDEFYTQLSDIEKELNHYKDHFKGKVVLCNCDDPEVSNFAKYFLLHFNDFGLKKVITTCYKNKSNDLFSRNDSEEAIYTEYNGYRKGENIYRKSDIIVKPLKGNGDFRSEECIELLKQSDIVVTNPPFSLFREYVRVLVEYDKKFIIIGNQNAISYKDCFKLIKENKMWLGINTNKTMLFNIPDNYKSEIVNEDGIKQAKVPAISWFTNLNHSKQNEELILYKKYNTKEYPKYDNYDAINIDEVKYIPVDYKGAMGVPITFLNKYNPEQFEILGAMTTTKIDDFNYGYPFINGDKIYARILIRHKNL